MLKKEFRDTLLILLQSSVLLLGIPGLMAAALLVGEKLLFADITFEVFLLTEVAFAGYSGLALFQSEKKDKGFEYLLTLPYSKLRIFVYKMLPRVSVVVVLGLVTVMVSRYTVVNWVLPLLCVQLGGVFMSLAFNRLFAGFVAGVVLGYFGVLYTMYIVYLFQFQLHLSPILAPHILAGLLLLIPLGISFFLAYKNFDLKPYKYTVRPYLFVALPLLLLQVIIVFINFEGLRRYF
ncbi:MAG: hypothetical protein GY950_06345 [bacterium]|nr:hypothetical protein [bacterium]